MFKTERIQIKIQERIEFSTTNIDYARCFWLCRVTLNMKREHSLELTCLYADIKVYDKDQDHEKILDFVLDNHHIIKAYKKHTLYSFYDDWKENYDDIYKD